MQVGRKLLRAGGKTSISPVAASRSPQPTPSSAAPSSAPWPPRSVGLHAAVRVLARRVAGRRLARAGTCPTAAAAERTPGSSPRPASIAAGTISHSICRTSSPVLRLERHRADGIECAGQVHRLGQLQPVKFDSPRADLAARQPVEGPHRFLQRCPRIKRMHLIQVNRLTPSRRSDASSAGSRYRRTARHVESHPAGSGLGGQHHRLSDPGRPVASQRPMISSDLPPP